MPHTRPAALDLLAGLLLFVLNLALVWPLFFVEYPASFYSIEGAYLGLARHLLQHGDTLGWFPWWYGGIPFPNTYPPFSHLLTAAWSALSGASVGFAYHQVTAAAYSLIPVAVFALGRSLRAEWAPAALSGLLVSLLSPAAILFGSIRADLGGWRFARRLHVLIASGEGPHLVSILLCLLALFFLVRVFTRPRPLWMALACLGCAATALTNWLGAVALAFGVVAALLAMEDPFRKSRWLIAVAIGVAAYALAAPWMPPSTIAAIRRNAPFVEGRFEATAQTGVYALAAAAGLLILLGVLRATGAPRALRFATLWTWMLGAVVALARKPGVALLPQPLRYHIELEIALLLAVALGLFWLMAEVLDRRRAALTGMALLSAATLLQAPVYWTYARQLIRASDGHSSIEAVTARWLSANLPGQRVWLPGSVMFWANAFAEIPQFGGGFDNGIQNPVTLAIHYQIYSSDGAGDRDGQIAATWLKSFGARAVVVSMPNSAEAYHPFRNPAKFDGLLDLLWEHQGMRIYRVPMRHEGLAFVVPEGAVPRSRPADGLDVAPAERYVAALEDTRLPETRFAWNSLSEATIDAELRDGQVLSVQIAHHPGWEAWAAEQRLDVAEDGLGQIVLRPGAGKHRLRLRFTGGWEQVFARSASAVSALLLVLLLIPALRKKAAALPAIQALARRL